jgi:hypothetical protein
MRLAIVGVGTVGSAALLALPRIASADCIDHVWIISRSTKTATGALLDAASAFPDFALRCSIAGKTRLSEADVIVFCAGALREADESRGQHLAKNARILEDYLRDIRLKPEALLIVVSSPVDDLTVRAHALSGLSRAKVFGFGGDLDYRRLRYVLSTDNQDASQVFVIGEHGPRVIPVYAGKAAFAKVALQVRTFLQETTNDQGRPRNLSSGVLLAQLINTVTCGVSTQHFVCGYHPEYAVFLTWPFLLGREGLIEPKLVKMRPQSEAELKKLLVDRTGSHRLCLSTSLASRPSELTKSLPKYLRS